jgi:dipeptidyl aminopeptidase/acylaminoacyl peptidase
MVMAPRIRRALRALTLALLLVPAPGMASSSHRAWTAQDIVTSPQIGDLEMTPDGKEVAYLLHTADIAANRPRFELHLITLADGRDRVIAQSQFLDRLRRIPGRNAWSVLGDFGAGVQLYEVGHDGARTELVRNPETVLVGSADGADFGLWQMPPLQVGIVFYDWSPDGKRLVYSRLEAESPVPRQLTGDAVRDASARRRWTPQVRVGFFMRTEEGPDVPIFERPSSDRIARYMGGMTVWGPDYLDFGAQASDSPDPAVQRYRWSFSSGKAVALSLDALTTAQADIIGPNGGQLEVSGRGKDRRLVERLGGGRSIDFGSAMMTLSDVRSPGYWRAADGRFAIVAVKLLREAKYALLRLDRDGGSRLIQVPESLTHCSFDAGLSRGVCIREGLAYAPELVKVNPVNGAISLVEAISPAHSRLERFAKERRTWINRFGFESVGFVLFPRGYRAGKRYPAVIVTHGSDADERFAAPDFEWSYPIQLLLDRGYLVLAVNDPYIAQSEQLQAAIESWNSCNGRLVPAEIQRLVWLNAVESYRSLIATLGDQGVIDPKRIGIAGYSAGSQMVNVAVTQTDLFRAASSGDGGYLEPAVWRFQQCSYRAVYGGAPGDPKARDNYAALAPSYRAARSKAAVLQQLAEPRAGAVEFHEALREARVPAQITLYPGETSASDETHFFHIPANRIGALEENLEWFERWLGNGNGAAKEGAAIPPAR